MCRSKTEREKLDEFRRLQKLHWEGMPSQQGISKSESADQTINQHSDGFSIVNLQWASFASGATVIIAVAKVGVLVTLCCYFRARNDRRRRERHHQLIVTISGRRPIHCQPLSMTSHQYWLGQNGIGHPMGVGQAPQSAPQPFPSMPYQPSLQPLEGRFTAFNNFPSLVSCPLLPTSGIVLLWNAGVSNIGFSHLLGSSSHLL